MLKDILRNFFVYITAIYTFYKLLNIKPSSPNKQLLLFFLSIITSVYSAFLFASTQSLNWIFILLIFFLTMKYFTKTTFTVTYATVLFSFSLSFITFSISAIITSLLLTPFYYQKYELPWFVVRLFIGMLHFSLTYCCFRIPRLQKGMKFIYNIPSGNIGSAICIFLIVIIIILCQPPTTLDSFSIKLVYGTLIFSFAIIYWWNYHITQTYKKFLRKNEIDSLNLLLEERNQEIIYLKSENDKLARIIHKDNKLIPALSMAIIDSLENKTELNLSEIESDSSLHLKLKQLYTERAEILANYQQEIMRLPQTAFDSVNAILSYMQTEALKSDIQYQVILFDNLVSTIPTEIAENDFTYMLSDLLANAINACKNAPSAAIHIYLGKMDGISTIKIYNTGSVFNIETLKNLGLAKHTTHADTGGSGIGLMDIWMIKERYAATLLIDEVTNSSSASTYTCINILFNHKNHYIVQSDRHKELSTYINRPDIMIISKE